MSLRTSFTLDRWAYPWQMYPLLLLASASAWQIVDEQYALISIANLAGSLTALIGLHVRNRRVSRGMERWGYLALVWSMCIYLYLALSGDGQWLGLIHNTNLGVALSQAVILASAHRVVCTILAERRRRKLARRQAKVIIAEVHGELGRDDGKPATK